MDNIIDQILEIDQLACGKIENAYDQKNSILLQAQEEEDKIKLDAVAKANEQAVGNGVTQNAIVDEKISLISKQTSETIKALNDIFEGNHKQWEDNIFKNITNNN